MQNVKVSFTGKEAGVMYFVYLCVSGDHDARRSCEGYSRTIRTLLRNGINVSTLQNMCREWQRYSYWTMWPLAVYALSHLLAGSRSRPTLISFLIISQQKNWHFVIDAGVGRPRMSVLSCRNQRNWIHRRRSIRSETTTQSQFNRKLGGFGRRWWGRQTTSSKSHCDFFFIAFLTIIDCVTCEDYSTSPS